MIGTIALRGIVGAMSFVQQVLIVNLWEGACVIMVNLPAHKVAGIQQAIEAAGARLVYLSPYSPEFSPLENCWSKIKEYLRSVAART